MKKKYQIVQNEIGVFVKKRFWFFFYSTIMEVDHSDLCCMTGSIDATEERKPRNFGTIKNAMDWVTNPL